MVNVKRMEKIPCIKYDPKDWGYVKKMLESFGYVKTILHDNFWHDCPYIVINLGNQIGNYSNVRAEDCTSHNREVVTDVEEFLERAAKLKGITYKRRTMGNFTKYNLRSGMVVKLNNDQYYLVVDNMLIGIYGQMPLEDYDGNMYLNDELHRSEYSIKEVYQKKYRSWGCGFNDSLENNLVLIWQRESKEYTMQEIADKLGIPVEQLRIKK